MAIISLKNFTGEIPRIPAHLLPENAAQTTKSCDFAYGELMGIKDATAGGTISGVSSPKAIWADDSNPAKFYAWTEHADTALSPVINDVHKRLYYSADNGNGIHVVAMKDGVTDIGGVIADYSCPPTSAGVNPNVGNGQKKGYKVGVPKPSALRHKLLNFEFSTTATTMGDPGSSPPNSGGAPQGWYPVIEGLNLAMMFFYEHNGVKYQECVVSIYNNALVTRAIPYCALQSWPLYAGDKLDPSLSERDTNICGRDFFVGYPPKILAPVNASVPVGTVWDSDANNGAGGTVASTANMQVETSPATPSEAKPMLQVIGTIKGAQAFSVYSEGSSFASSRGVYGVNLYVNPYSANTLACGLKYGIKETRSYVYTYINIFGEESLPSDPLTVDVGYGQTVMLCFDFTQTTEYAPIASTRTYATNTSSQGNTDWYFASDGGNILNLAGTTQVPTDVAMRVNPYPGSQMTRPENYGERLTSQDNELQPAGATGLCALPNGILACFRNVSAGAGPGNNEVYFSEPYHPSAWPAKYVQTFPWDVVAIKPQGNGLVVVTKGNPYYVYGTHPESMSSVKLQAMQAGVSKRAICDIGSHVIYASHDGLVAVQNTDVNIELSQKFFTREKWRALYGDYLSYLCLAYHDGMLIGYFTQATVQGFVIRFDEAAGTFTRTVTQTVTGTSHCTSQLDDKLYFCVSQAIRAFASGTTQQAYEWRSKDFIFPAPVCMAGGQIILDDTQSGTVTIKVYADGIPGNPYTATPAITASGYFRLPSGFRTRKWSVSIEAGRTVKELYLVTSMKELAGV